MKDPLDKVMFVLYGLFGAGLGLLIFLIALGGLRYVVMGEAARPWNGLVALILCCGFTLPGWRGWSRRLRQVYFP